jgi:DinB superfamily
MRSRNQSGEIRVLLRAIDEGFDQAAWHGPNLRGSLRGLSVAQAAWRPAPGRHNIWELAVHAAYWKYVVRRTLQGTKRGAFSEDGSNWFRRGNSANEKAWRKDLSLLENEHRLLRDAVAQVDPAKLNQRGSTKKWILADHILGIAFHDIYHAGQIRLLRRMQQSPAKRS